MLPGPLVGASRRRRGEEEASWLLSSVLNICRGLRFVCCHTQDSGRTLTLFEEACVPAIP
jgi:hypothetical protein